MTDTAHLHTKRLNLARVPKVDKHRRWCLQKAVETGVGGWEVLHLAKQFHDYIFPPSWGKVSDDVLARMKACQEAVTGGDNTAPERLKEDIEARVGNPVVGRNGRINEVTEADSAKAKRTAEALFESLTGDDRSTKMILQRAFEYGMLYGRKELYPDFTAEENPEEENDGEKPDWLERADDKPELSVDQIMVEAKRRVSGLEDGPALNKVLYHAINIAQHQAARRLLQEKAEKEQTNDEV